GLRGHSSADSNLLNSSPRSHSITPNANRTHTKPSLKRGKKRKWSVGTFTKHEHSLVESAAFGKVKGLCAMFNLYTSRPQIKLTSHEIVKRHRFNLLASFLPQTTNLSF